MSNIVPLSEAVLNAVGLNPRDPKTQALCLLADKYQLDVLLGEIFLVQGRPFISRDGQLALAHRSGDFDGMTTKVEQLPDRYEATTVIYRKSMTHPFAFTDVCMKNEKVSDHRKRAITRSERNALKRAFAISLDVYDPADEPRRTRAAVVALPAPPPPLPEVGPVPVDRAAAVERESTPVRETPVVEVVGVEPPAEQAPQLAPAPPATPTNDGLDDRSRKLMIRFRELEVSEEERHRMISEVTGGRTESVRELEDAEAGKLHLMLHALRKEKMNAVRN